MKKNISIIAMMAMALTFVACSSDEEEAVTNDATLNTTVWSYSSGDYQHTGKTYTDKENFHQLEALLEECPSISRSFSNSNLEESMIENDLCEGHGAHSSISMTFNGANCHFVDTEVRYIQEVKKSVETYDCTFTEGQYMGYSDHSYRSYIVTRNAVYKGTVNGDICVIALDGNFTYNAKSTTYKSQLTTKQTNIANANLTYSRKGNNIEFQGNGIEISGTIESNPSRMVLHQTKPTEKDFVLTN